jgi:hypothetical protein
MAVVAGAALAVAFNSGFQTWWVQRRLAMHPDWGVTAGTISAGLRRVELRNWRVVRSGGVLTLPAVDLELPVTTAVLGGPVDLRRCVVQGWTLEMSPAQRPPVGGASEAGSPGEVVARVREAFAGVLGGWSSPVDLALDRADLEGTVILPDGRGRVRLRIAGGGFYAGLEGKLQVMAEAALHDPRVSAVAVRATLAGRMLTPRALAELRLDLVATAQGAQFPDGVGLAGAVAVARGQDRETYALKLSTQTHEILNLAAAWPAGSGRMAGSWKLNMRDTDVGPFALGVKLPQFSTAGEGRFELELATAGLEASGNLAATAGGLGVLRPELAVLGEVKLHGDFDLAHRDGVYAVRRLVAALATADPVATVTALQPFEFNPASGALRPTDATRALVGVKVHGLPVAWARPLLGEIALAGGNLQGEFTGLARDGGIVLRTTRNVTMADASLSRGTQRWLEGVDLSFATSVDYNPQGWQAEINRLGLRKGNDVLLTLDARAGRLKGSNESLKTTGKLAANLAFLLAQPFAAGMTGLASGEAAVEFAASLGQTKELYAKVELKKLQGVSQGKGEFLPSLAGEVRADLEADGKMVFRVPVVVEAGARQSDFAIAGTMAPAQGRIGRCEAVVTGAQVVVADLRILGAALSPWPARQSVGAGSAPWAGFSGATRLEFGRIELSERWQASQASGRIEVVEGALKLEGLQAGFGEKGRASLSGALTFEGGPQPYQLDATVALKEFDLSSCFAAVLGQARPALDGRFELAGQLTSRAGDLAELVPGAGGEFRFTSKGGVFRGLPVTVSQAVANTGRVAGFIAAAGSALGGLTGRKEPVAVAGRPQAVAELATAISTIAFDQLSFGFTRDAGRNGVVRDFALIAPELRLTGGGSWLHRPGADVGDDSLAMEFKLRARGRQAELLRYLGVLDSVTDELGYAACSLPLRLGGTMARPDASDLSTRLAALAIEKSGVTEKASELFNRIIGGGK